MELPATETFLYTRLKAILPDGTPVAAAPYEENQPLPAVVYKLLSSNDVSVVGGSVYLSTSQYLVVAQCEGADSSKLDSIVRLIHLGLQQRGGTNASGTVFSCVRVRAHSMPYRSESGKVYQQCGYVFEISARGSYGT